MAKIKTLSVANQAIRDMAEKDLFMFAKMVNPTYVYGAIHREIFSKMGNPNRKDNLLFLIPRAHLKSHCAAVNEVQAVCANPNTSILYITANMELGKAQMEAMKTMLESPTVSKYWPELIKDKETERKTWNATTIKVDHPLRTTRDATILIRTVGQSSTGLHADRLVYDDVVVPENAYTELGRQTVAAAVAQFGSVLNPNGFTTAVGTRYHPKDIYQSLEEAMDDIWDEESQSFIGQEHSWDIMNEVVEDEGDMTGNFLWPRTFDAEGVSAYGFDSQTLAKIKSKYASLGNTHQFFAQYYNNPNDDSLQRVTSDSFQYYNEKLMHVDGTSVYYKDKKLTVVAAMDIAWTVNKRSDFTAIAVCGIDYDGFIYILDLDEYKTDKFAKYYKSIIDMQRKWKFNRIIIETNSGGKLVADQIGEYVRKNGNAIIVDGRYTTKSDGAKFERHAAILEPRYANRTIFHPESGRIKSLEEQIKLANPKNDDLKDAVTTCVAELKAPLKNTFNIDSVFNDNENNTIHQPNTGWGGRRR